MFTREEIIAPRKARDTTAWVMDIVSMVAHFLVLNISDKLSSYQNHCQYLNVPMNRHCYLVYCTNVCKTAHYMFPDKKLLGEISSLSEKLARRNIENYFPQGFHFYYRSQQYFRISHFQFIWILKWFQSNNERVCGKRYFKGEWIQYTVFHPMLIKFWNCTMRWGAYLRKALIRGRLLFQS